MVQKLEKPEKKLIIVIEEEEKPEAKSKKDRVSKELKKLSKKAKYNAKYLEELKYVDKVRSKVNIRNLRMC